uniref:Uncharacterized protein n=1 Tax=Oryza sativa subsp. japonica TaxID=39947 RepID=Q9FWE8_ORYSJ|nr:unknown protein [Oryza sativa Japonica Group]
MTALAATMAPVALKDGGQRRDYHPCAHPLLCEWRRRTAASGGGAAAAVLHLPLPPAYTCRFRHRLRSRQPAASTRHSRRLRLPQSPASARHHPPPPLAAARQLCVASSHYSPPPLTAARCFARPRPAVRRRRIEGEGPGPKVLAPVGPVVKQAQCDLGGPRLLGRAAHSNTERVDREAVGASNDFDLLNQMDSLL